MPNRNYLRGRAFEFYLMAKIKEEGGFPMRSSGSHGKFDVVGVFPDKKEIALYQAKTKLIKKGKQRTEYEVEPEYELLNGQKFDVRFVRATKYIRKVKPHARRKTQKDS